MSDFHSRMMNIPREPKGMLHASGHRDARHAAAEIANEADAEIARLRARIAEMDEALRPFSEIAGEMFARNWELGRVVVALDNPDGANRVLFDDFLRARKALEG